MDSRLNMTDATEKSDKARDDAGFIKIGSDGWVCVSVRLIENLASSIFRLFLSNWKLLPCLLSCD